jgi:hypothetical protein
VQLAGLSFGQDWRSHFQSLSGAQALNRYQLAKHGTSIEGVPPPEVKRGSDGELVIYDGVTRATRVAKYLPGTPITVEVTGQLKGPVAGLPTVGEKV